MKPIRNTLLVLGLFTLGVTACETPTETLHLNYPRGEFSTESVDFGEAETGATISRTVWFQNQGDLDMGISEITKGENDKSANFSVKYSEDDIECPETEDTGATAKFMLDSGGPVETGDPGDTDDDDDDDDDGGTPEELELLLGPKCRVPLQINFSPTELGELWGSIIVHSKTEKVDEEDASAKPTYFSDPLHSHRILYVNGEGERGIQNIVVSPMRYDYGHLWTGEVTRAHFAIENLGDGTLTVDEPYLDEGCDEGFEITNDNFVGTLKADQSTYVELTYTPQDTDPAYCTILVDSNDEDSPTVDIDIQANVGQDPENRPATVVIRSPEIGHQHTSMAPLEMELNIFDVNQPATSLLCKVKSMVLAEAASVVQCSAEDESGHIFVEIDPEELGGVGVDTLRVQVTDASQIISYATVPVLFNTPYPESDDDGDGWGDEPDEYGNFDCDDLNRNSYPYAVEVADGEDNDCDGVADESTTAYDDDGDSYSEDDGDCNDYDADIYPGAREAADSKDNNCDGVVDENTSLFDDDGDGYTELNGDCDDDNVNINPGAIEYCDGLDNDCNGLYDDHDNCVEIYSEPYLVGVIKLQQTACEPGDQIVASAKVFDADGQSAQFTWSSADEDLVIEPLTGSSTVTITCPEPSNSNGEIYGFNVFASDEDGNAIWDFGEISVYPSNAGLYDYYTQIVRGEKKGLCSAVPLAPFASLSILGLGLALVRRRRD